MFKFCSLLKSESWQVRLDVDAKVPYAVKGADWVSYDDVTSIVEKVNYALSLDIAGVMIWSIETDDFNAICHDEKFPLLHAINRALGISNGTSSTTAQTPTTTTSSVASSTVSSTVPSATESSTPSSAGDIFFTFSLISTIIL